MRACKCDRCGQLFELPKVGELSGFAWLVGFDEMGETEFGKQYDLCADCTSALSDFMEGDNGKRTEPTESGRGMEEVRREADEVHETEDPDREEADSSDVPTKMRQYSIEEQVKMRLSGMMPKEIAEKIGAAPATVSVNINRFKKYHPDKYKQLADEVEGNP